MVDYSELLNSKTKKRVLMDKFEEQKNLIQYYVDEHSDEECVDLLEGVVSVMTEFLATKDITVKATDYQA